MFIKLNDLGGAKVMRTFRMGTKQIRAGTMLTETQLANMTRANLRALIESGFLAPWPKGGVIQAQALARFARHRGFGEWDVIEGRLLNTDPMPREMAQELVAEGVAR